MKSRMTITVAASVLAIIAPLTTLATQANAQDLSAKAGTTPTPSPTPTTPVPTTTATPTPVPTPTPTEEATQPTSTWQPKPGVRFNEPRDPKQSHNINSYIRKAIANSPKGSQIRLVTWNYSNAL